jgi:hypothetical protein
MPLKTLDVLGWRAPTNQQILEWMEARGKPETPKPSLLAFRTHLVPADVYCYLKARFGEPNGFQTFIRRNDSNNWIHWDYVLKAMTRMCIYAAPQGKLILAYRSN